jgi:hypothetical protein
MEAYYQRCRILAGNKSDDIYGFIERALSSAQSLHQTGGASHKQLMNAATQKLSKAAQRVLSSYLLSNTAPPIR